MPFRVPRLAINRGIELVHPLENVEHTGMDVPAIVMFCGDAVAHIARRADDASRALGDLIGSVDRLVTSFETDDEEPLKAAIGREARSLYDAVDKVRNDLLVATQRMHLLLRAEGVARLPDVDSESIICGRMCPHSGIEVVGYVRQDEDAKGAPKKVPAIAFRYVKMPEAALFHQVICETEAQQAEIQAAHEWVNDQLNEKVPDLIEDYLKTSFPHLLPGGD